MRLRITLLALTVIFLHVLATEVEACSCIVSGPPCQAYWATPVVFMGQVAEITEVPHTDPQMEGFSERLVRFNLAEAFRGVSAPTTEAYTGMGGGDCGYPFKVGEAYLVYAYENPKTKKLYAGICSRTRPVSEAGEDLDYIRGLDRSGRGGTIYGSVVKFRRVRQGEGYPQPAPLSGVKLTYEGVGQRGETMTNDKGDYRLSELPAGTYQLRLIAPKGLWGDTAERKVEVPERGCAVSDYRLEPDTSLSGRVFNEEGRPASKMMVDLVPVEQIGERYQPNNQFTSADEEGRFTFRSLVPGNYYLGVRLSRISDPQLDYPRTFYPGTRDPAQAARVVIREGETLEGYEWRLPARLAKRKIEGQIVWPDGRPVQNAQMCFEEVEYAEGGMCFGGDAQVDVSGHFSFTAQEGIRYLVRAHVNVGGGGSGQRHAEPIEAAAEGDVTDLRLVVSEPNGNCEKCNRWTRKKK